MRSDPPALWNEETTGEIERKTDALPTEADIDALISQFRVSDASDQQHARALKAIAELEPTPAPPRGSARIVVRADAPPKEKAAASLPRESDIEALLALNDESPPPMPPIPPSPGLPSVTILQRPQTPTRARDVPSMAPAAGARRWRRASVPSRAGQPPRRARPTLPSVH